MNTGINIATQAPKKTLNFYQAGLIQKGLEKTDIAKTLFMFFAITSTRKGRRLGQESLITFIA